MKKMISTQFFTVLILLLACAIANTSYGMKQGRVKVTHGEYSDLAYFENSDEIYYYGLRKDGTADTCYYKKTGEDAGRKQCHRTIFDPVDPQQEPLSAITFDNLKSLYDAAKEYEVENERRQLMELLHKKGLSLDRAYP